MILIGYVSLWLMLSWGIGKLLPIFLCFILLNFRCLLDFYKLPCFTVIVAELETISVNEKGRKINYIPFLVATTCFLLSNERKISMNLVEASFQNDSSDIKSCWLQCTGQS